MASVLLEFVRKPALIMMTTAPSGSLRSICTGSVDEHGKSCVLMNLNDGLFWRGYLTLNDDDVKSPGTGFGPIASF